MSLESTLTEYNTMLTTHKALMNNLINKSTFDNKQREQNNKISTLERNVTISLKSTRNINGTWSITNLSTDKILIITISTTGNGSQAAIRCLSGAEDLLGGTAWYFLGTAGYSVFALLKPTQSTINIEVVNISGSFSNTVLKAYQ